MAFAREPASLELKDNFIHEEELPNHPLDEDQQWRKKESQVLRKLDIFIGPYLALLMILSHLDRSNIGFAATQGMTSDIGLKGTQFNVRAPISC